MLMSRSAGWMDGHLHAHSFPWTSIRRYSSVGVRRSPAPERKEGRASRGRRWCRGGRERQVVNILALPIRGNPPDATQQQHFFSSFYTTLRWASSGFQTKFSRLLPVQSWRVVLGGNMKFCTLRPGLASFPGPGGSNLACLVVGWERRPSLQQ